MTSPIGAIGSATNIHKGFQIFANNNPAQGTTEYLIHANMATTTETDFQMAVPGMILTAMRVDLGGNVGGSGQTCVVTVRDDAVDTSLTVSIASGASNGSITGESAAVVAGSLLSIESVLSATTGTLQICVLLEYTIDT